MKIKNILNRIFPVNSKEAMTKMPDGRPLYAWENENIIAKQLSQDASALMKQANDKMKLLRIAEIESMKEPWSGDLVIRFRMVDSVNLDFDSKPEKYYKREKHA